MTRKIILIFVFIILQMSKGFSQDKPRVYFNGIEGNVIKISQLSDTAIKIVTNIIIPRKGIGVEIYFSGEGFPNVMMQTVSLGASLNFIKNKLNIGSNVSIGGFVTKNYKTGKNIYFEGSSYKIIAD